MQFTLTLINPSSTHIVLPLHYNYLIQSAIYRSLSPDFASFLHSTGYMIDKRRFPLFVFSRIIGSFQINKEQKWIRFSNPVQLIISSPISQFMQDTAQLLLSEGIQIGQNRLEVDKLEMLQPKVTKEEITVVTQSPIVAYSTFVRGDGKKYTLYYSPGDKEFKRIVSENLMRKARLLYGEDIDVSGIDIHCYGRYRREVVLYKGIVIKGYSGRFILKGDPCLLQTAIDAGIGSKNSMGFGLIQTIPEK
ncbi:CRISPR-associated endoribonuclease Cas6 [Microaerobacter geothermalis]|uniref:CRISPR-associated endoribonuclease Cas6 n=1 Tax=Microaerobacter geothermalis TaxID=674972 RepID=UPI001F421EB4|nr:CRISPR-associated endoribonuclease Cas6 [Microaerobacter geothermalis]MCF6094005.1 CRISPR-associated endoribonuclease Cas6 [Microaerobacter geothermalis]